MKRRMEEVFEILPRIRARIDQLGGTLSIGDYPMTFAKLKILQPQSCRFSSPEAAADQECEQGVIASALQSITSFRCQQPLALFCC